MKSFSKILFITISIIIFTACESRDTINPQIANQRITKTNLHTIAEQMKKDTTIPSEYIEMFTDAITLFGNTPDSINGKTVAQLIASQEKFYRQQSVNNLINSTSRIAMFMNTTFQYVGIQFADTNGEKFNNIVFDIKNTSDKEIKSVHGILQFYTPEGELLKVFELNTGIPIPVIKENEQPMRFYTQFIHNDSIQNDIKIRTDRNLRAIWVPAEIIFSDNTKLEDKATIAAMNASKPSK